MPKTAQFIEETKAQAEISDKPQKRQKSGFRGPSPDVGKATQFKPGAEWRGNAGGRPKSDVAAQLARAVIEGNFEAAFEGLSKQLNKGNAYTFKELADRGYGKLKETKEVTHIHQDVEDADLTQRIADLERDLGLAAAIDEAGRAGIAQAGTSKTNGHAKDSDLLPK